MRKKMFWNQRIPRKSDKTQSFQRDFFQGQNYFLLSNNLPVYELLHQYFQRGGISMEEMICPVIHLKNKNALWRKRLIIVLNEQSVVGIF